MFLMVVLISMAIAADCLGLSTLTLHAATGVLLDQTDSWSVIFGVVSVVYAVGFAGFAAWGSGELQNYDD